MASGHWQHKKGNSDTSLGFDIKYQMIRGSAHREAGLPMVKCLTNKLLFSPFHLLSVLSLSFALCRPLEVVKVGGVPPAYLRIQTANRPRPHTCRLPDISTYQVGAPGLHLSHTPGRCPVRFFQGCQFSLLVYDSHAGVTLTWVTSGCDVGRAPNSPSLAVFTA